MTNTPLESKTENEFKEFVEANDCLYLKFSILGMVGFPDRIILGKHRLIFFIEWKRQGVSFLRRRGVKLQAHRHKVLRGFGFSVYLLDNLKEAKEAFFVERAPDIDGCKW